MGAHQTVKHTQKRTQYTNLLDFFTNFPTSMNKKKSTKIKVSAIL